MYGVPFTKCLYEGADCERETAKGEEPEMRQAWGLGMALGVRLRV